MRNAARPRLFQFQTSRRNREPFAVAYYCRRGELFGANFREPCRRDWTRGQDRGGVPVPCLWQRIGETVTRRRGDRDRGNRADGHAADRIGRRGDRFGQDREPFASTVRHNRPPWRLRRSDGSRQGATVPAPLWRFPCRPRGVRIGQPADGFGRGQDRGTVRRPPVPPTGSGIGSDRIGERSRADGATGTGQRIGAGVPFGSGRRDRGNRADGSGDGHAADRATGSGTGDRRNRAPLPLRSPCKGF